MDDWQIDVAQQIAQHSSGLQINFEGKPQSRHFSGTPSKVPQEMPPLKLVQLIREGYQAYEEAFIRISPPPASTAASQEKALSSDEEVGVKVRRRRRRRVPD
ncbi:MAG: hypothetical protein EA349_09640 [Halomonadaceae bacterium]|nr:MAG: hypothetical protein EA349_09640 [Halomonadaceae bacterium]